MEIKRDCFAYVGSKCNALTTTDCEQCVFYKASGHVQAGRLKAKQRIESLNTATREYIMKKYYNH